MMLRHRPVSLLVGRMAEHIQKPAQCSYDGRLVIQVGSTVVKALGSLLIWQFRFFLSSEPRLLTFSDTGGSLVGLLGISMLLAWQVNIRIFLLSAPSS